MGNKDPNQWETLTPKNEPNKEAGNTDRYKSDEGTRPRAMGSALKTVNLMAEIERESELGQFLTRERPILSSLREENRFE